MYSEHTNIDMNLGDVRYKGRLKHRSATRLNDSVR